VTTQWRITAHEGLDGLRELEADWHRLTSAIPDRGFHQLYETHVAFVKHMPHSYGPIIFLALRDGDTVRAICPVERQVRPILGIKRRAWGLPMGGGDLPRDLVCPPDDDARRVLLPLVIEFLRRQDRRRRWLVLERVLETSGAWKALDSLDEAHVTTDITGAVSFIPCDMTFDQALARLSKNFRQNLRNQTNRLNALADVRFETAADPASVNAALDTFLDVEASGWKGHAGTNTAIAAKPRLLGFHREMITNLHGDDRCELNLLYAEGRCIGGEFCLRTGEQYSVLKTGFVEDYARAAPGHLLLLRALERACADPQLKRLDMVSNASWVDVWKPDVVPTQLVFIGYGAGAGVMTQALRARFKYGPRVKKVLHRVRDAVRRAKPRAQQV
jgi:CelD/BcsL family acetyltransferase involved in cellulose biosynthesis